MNWRGRKRQKRLQDKYKRVVEQHHLVILEMMLDTQDKEETREFMHSLEDVYGESLMYKLPDDTQQRVCDLFHG